MKKRSLLFALLIALIAPFAAQAQETVTIGDGTSTDYYTPIGTYYNYSITEQLYTADEIGMAGTINSISFNYASTIAKDFPITVYMANVDAENLSTGISLADAEVVFEGTYSVTGEGWMTITLDTPFAYDGTSNLLIGINKDYVYWFSGNWNHTVTEAVMARYSNNDNSAYTTTTVPASTSTSRPNIQINITPGSVVICNKPETLVIENVTTDAATLTWTGGSGVYNIELNGTIIEEDYEGNTYNLTELSPATAYTVKVQSVCDDATSGWKSVSFTTECDIIPALGYTENFDSYTAGNNVLPNCWSYINTTTNSTYAVYPRVYANSYSTYANSAPNCLYLYSYGGSDPQPQYAILPEMTGLAGLQVTLMAKGYNASSTLKIGTMSDPTDASTFTMIAEQTLTTSYPTEPFEFIIPANCSDSYLAIMMDAAPSGYNTRGVYVDDITIAEVPTCLKPTELAVTGVSTTTATLGWTNGADDQTAWQIMLNGNETNLIMANSNPFTIEDLTAATSYTAKVRAYCGADDQSDWSNEVSFTTACEAITDLPWNENFDAYTGSTSSSVPTGYPNDEMPNCWQFLNRSNNTSTYPQVFISSNSGYPVSGNCLFFRSSSTTPLYAILPAFEEEIAALQLTFTYRNEGTSDSNGTLIVGYMTNPADATTFTPVLTCERTTTLTEKEVLFPEAPTGSYIAFMYQGGTSNNYYLSIDNVKVDVIPTCVKPTGLEATANALTATITWVSEVGEYEVAYSTDNTVNPDENIAGTATEETYTMNDLALGDHYFWVRANCGSDGYSEWVGPVSVHIGYCVPTPSNVDGNGISNVTFGMGDNIVNNDTPKATYADYSSQIGAVQAGVESTIAITYATGYTYGTIIWVDLDNSLSFEDSEIVYTGTSGDVNPTTLNAAITIPATQTPGDYMMRIGGADSGFDSYISGSSTTAPSACYTGNWACFQDYTLRVLEAPSCMMPTTVAINYTSGTTATVTWQGTTETYNIDVNGTVTNDVTTPYTLENLDLATTYEVKVQANCDGDETSEWSNAVSFTTDMCMPENQCEITFELTDSYGDGWNGGAGIRVIDVETNIEIGFMTNEDLDGESYDVSELNTLTLAVCDGREIQFVWVSGTYDEECSYVVKDANGVEIFSGEDAMDEPFNYTVNCGGASYTLEIEGVGEENWEGGKSGYYLIASPVTVDLSNHEMTTGDFDLYSFDEGEEDEWRNYEAGAFTTLEPGKGYLYAHKIGGDFILSGTPYTGNGEVTLHKTTDAQFEGWNLVGNPYADEAYIERPYYRIDGAAVLDELETGAINAMEGVFVIAENDEETITFSTEQPGSKVSRLAINLSQGHNIMDRAIVRFDEGRQLPKFQLNENSTKVFIPQEGKDYAVVRSEAMGEMPVSFKAQSNGSYTFSFNAEEVSFAYLHLIDNMTGIETDLLANPSYNFEARTTDYANRFKLVFATGNADDDFAFFSNGSFVINNEGIATVQVIDVNGRIISSESINGCANVNVKAAAGVYMIRLVNGDNVKVQKVVVK